MKHLVPFFIALFWFHLSASNLTAQTLVACSIDTVEYPMLKSSGESMTSLNTGDVQGIAQWYELPENLTLHGISLRAGVKRTGLTNQTASLVVSVYNSTADSLPQAVPVITTTVTIDTNYQTYKVPFLTSIPVNSNFLVAVEYGAGLTDNDTVLVGLSNPGDGDQESLGAAQLNTGGNTVWLPFENVLSNPDRDAFIFPWTSYNLSADFTFPADTQCVDAPVLFTNTSSPIAASRMYNLRIEDPSTYGAAYSWDLDGLASNLFSPSRSFDSVGTKTILLTTALTGYHTTCSEPIVKDLVIEERPVASFVASATSVSHGDTVFFTNMSMGSGSCSWDFGDSTSVTSCMDQTHIYDTSGTFQVILTVTSPYGCMEQDTMEIMVAPQVGIGAALIQGSLQVFPSPATHTVKANWDIAVEGDVRLSIVNLQGQQVWSQSYTQVNKAQVSVQELPAGIYFLRLQSPQGSETAKFVKQD